MTPTDAERDAALGRIRDYVDEIDAFYGAEEIGDVIDNADGSPRSAALTLSDLRAIAGISTPPAPTTSGDPS